MVAENTVSKVSLPLDCLSLHFGVTLQGHLDNMFVLIHVKPLWWRSFEVKPSTKIVFLHRITYNRHMTIMIRFLSIVIT